MRDAVGRCRLPELLAQRGLNQQELCFRTKIPAQQISDYANGRRVMSLKTAKTISGALGCRIEDLYEWQPRGDE